MSWSFSVPSQPGASFDASTARAQYEAELAEHDHDLSDEAKAQVDAALAAVKSIIDSGVVGSEDVVVNIGGHANPDHKPADGWASDCVSLTVQFVPAPVVEEPADPAPTDPVPTESAPVDATTAPAVTDPAKTVTDSPAGASADWTPYTGDTVPVAAQ